MIINGNSLEVLKTFEDNSVDLICTDPPYLIENTKAGGNSNLAKSIQGMNNELKDGILTEGITNEYLEEMIRVMKNINCYIWCNHKQIPQYLDFFTNKYKCKFDIIIWNKTNPMPLFNNKYMTDKEYCLYFRKNSYCNPECYEDAKTVFYQPINIKDKKLWKHPTIKPLNIIKNLIKNSSKKNELVLDPFCGSGTTGVACKMLNRNFIGIDLDPEYCKISEARIKAYEEENKQGKLI